MFSKKEPDRPLQALELRDHLSNVASIPASYVAAMWTFLLGVPPLPKLQETALKPHANLPNSKQIILIAMIGQES